MRACVCVTLAVAIKQPGESRHVWRNAPCRAAVSLLFNQTGRNLEKTKRHAVSPSSCSPCAVRLQLAAATFFKTNYLIYLKIQRSRNGRGGINNLRRSAKSLSIFLISPQHSGVQFWCRASGSPPGEMRVCACVCVRGGGLTICLQLLIAGNEMPSGADH